MISRDALFFTPGRVLPHLRETPLPLRQDPLRPQADRLVRQGEQDQVLAKGQLLQV